MKLKYILYSTSIFIVIMNYANSYTIEKEVVERSKNFRAIKTKRVLKNLKSSSSYDGKFFKIVLGKSNRAISFDSSKELQLKAATTYYHLSKARRYFIDVLKSTHVSGLPQLVIRIDIKNKFSELGHFAHDNLDPEYNNAVSIPAGIGLPSRGVVPWNNEIWFRPPKRVHIEEFSGPQNQQGILLKNTLKQFRSQTHMTSFQQFLVGLITGNDFISGGDDLFSNVMRIAGTSIMIEAIYHSTDFASEFFGQKWYYLDAALVPEVIYHEFAHIALSDHLEINHSTPVNEGMADYFAGKIANSKELATKIKDYNLFSGKKVKKKDLYRTQFEKNDYANADFVFGLLWQSQKILTKKKAPLFIYSMRTRLESDGNIRSQLVNAFIENCKQECSSPFLTNLKLYKFFHFKGI